MEFICPVILLLILILALINFLLPKTITLLYSVFAYTYVINTLYGVLDGLDSLSGIMRCTANSTKFMLIFMIQEMIPCFVNHDLCIILFLYVINNNSKITPLVRILIAVFLLFLYSFNYLLKQFLNS